MGFKNDVKRFFKGLYEANVELQKMNRGYNRMR